MYLAEDRIDTGFFPYEPGSPDAMIHNDHLATPQKMTDATGAVVWAADFKPFGEATITVSAITNNLRFPGQYFDQETGLNYNYYRDYNPAIGRYIESDPEGIDKGRNHLFAYVKNNPLRWKDFYGLKAMCGDKCKDDADKKYKKCMDTFATANTVITVVCVIGNGIAYASGNVPGGIAGTVGCFLVTNIEPKVGEAYCGFWHIQDYALCDSGALK